MIPSFSIVSLRYLIVTKRDEIPAKGECVLVESDWTISYWLNDKCHRDDGPAVEYPNGTKYWYRNDKLHRDNGPAIEYPDGTKYWYRNDKRHRDDGPAVEYPNGSKYWFRDGKRVHSKRGKSK